MITRVRGAAALAAAAAYLVLLRLRPGMLATIEPLTVGARTGSETS